MIFTSHAVAFVLSKHCQLITAKSSTVYRNDWLHFCKPSDIVLFFVSECKDYCSIILLTLMLSYILDIFYNSVSNFVSAITGFVLIVGLNEFIGNSTRGELWDAVYISCSYMQPWQSAAIKHYIIIVLTLYIMHLCWTAWNHGCTLVNFYLVNLKLNCQSINGDIYVCVTVAVPEVKVSGGSSPLLK